MNTARVKLIGKTSPNELLQSILQAVEIHSFKEIIPSMNDIFISKVQNEAITSSPANLTE
jgi:ABC-2 type transport system ATP-binding protein